MSNLVGVKDYEPGDIVEVISNHGLKHYLPIGFVCEVVRPSDHFEDPAVFVEFEKIETENGPYDCHYLSACDIKLVKAARP